MNKKKQNSESKKEKSESSQLIRKQTEDFLNGGGKINIIEKGVSGTDPKSPIVRQSIMTKKQETH